MASVRVRFASDETGWAESLGDNKYRINNIPLSGGLNIDDIVLCEDVDGWLTVSEVLEKHYPGKTCIKYENVDQYRALREKMHSLDCKVEGLVGPQGDKEGICVVAHHEGIDLKQVVEELGIKCPQYDDEEMDDMD